MPQAKQEGAGASDAFDESADGTVDNHGEAVGGLLCGEQVDDGRP